MSLLSGKKDRDWKALSNLKPFSDYEVSILAYTLSGDGVTSSSITVTTDESGKLYL